MKKRFESFFGLHFDYHAQPKYGLQGENLREEEIREICRVLKPDFIQIDWEKAGFIGDQSQIVNRIAETDPTGDAFAWFCSIAIRCQFPGIITVVIVPGRTEITFAAKLKSIICIDIFIGILLYSSSYVTLSLIEYQI